MKFKSKEVQVKISRSAQFAPVVRVFEHEVPILEEINGDGAVALMPSKAKPVVKEFDSVVERARLKNKYKTRELRAGGCPVEAVYGNKANSTLGQRGARRQEEPQEEAA